MSCKLERKGKDRTERPVPYRPPKEEEDASSGIPEDSVDFGGGTEARSPTEEPAQDEDPKQEGQVETIVLTDPEEMKVHLKLMHEYLSPHVKTPSFGRGKSLPYGQLYVESWVLALHEGRLHVLMCGIEESIYPNVARYISARDNYHEIA